MDKSPTSPTDSMRRLTLSEYIEAFRCVIELSWPAVSSTDPYPDINFGIKSPAVGDWQQVQWELLVEDLLRWTGQLDGYLAVYGHGCDEGASSRFTKPDVLPTHEVCFLPVRGNKLKDCIEGKDIEFPQRGLRFDDFVSMGTAPHRWPNPQPPFDHVLTDQLRRPLAGDAPLVFPYKDIKFVLREIEVSQNE